jgi:hypothetical protein
MTIFGTLIAFKLVTALWVFYMQPTMQSAAFLTLTSAAWFGLVAVLVLLGGGLFWFRLLRVRARRRRLIEQEWRVGATVPPR